MVIADQIHSIGVFHVLVIRDYVSLKIVWYPTITHEVS